MSVEFVDTNILLYAHSKGAGERHTDSAALIERLSEQRTGALSVQVLSEFCAIAIRKFRLPNDYIELVIRDFAHWTIHRPGHGDVMQALALQRKHKLSWWDSMIVNSAIESGADILWSEDLQAGRHFGRMTIRNPF